MSLKLVQAPDYRGEAGIDALRVLQEELVSAMNQEEWSRVRRLDGICILLIDRVIAANRDDKNTLMRVLSETKTVYADLIARCHHEEALLQAN